MTSEEYAAHIDNEDGLCFNCGTIKSGGIKFDATGCHCDKCGKNQVRGIEQALLDSGIELVDYIGNDNSKKEIE